MCSTVCPSTVCSNGKVLSSSQSLTFGCCQFPWIRRTFSPSQFACARMSYMISNGDRQEKNEKDPSVKRSKEKAPRLCWQPVGAPLQCTFFTVRDDDHTQTSERDHRRPSSLPLSISPSFSSSSEQCQDRTNGKHRQHTQTNRSKHWKGD